MESAHDTGPPVLAKNYSASSGEVTPKRPSAAEADNRQPATRNRTTDPVSPEPALTALRTKHLLGIADLSREEIVLILNTAEAMKEVGQRAIKKVPTLRGRTVINLFFEPSTRTRTSFEIAEKRLSADTLNVAIGT